jgi:glutathione peroxidase
MTKWETSFLLAGVVAACVSSAYADDKGGALAFKMKSITGKEVDLAEYKGKVVLMVNVASKCGLTPQYEAMEALYEKYKDKGLVVLGFPCNQFSKQEPGTDAQIAEFCSETYKVKFPMFSKVEVNGENASPLYKFLTSLETQPAKRGNISWNFEKFVVGKNGQVVARFSPPTAPDAKEVLAVVEKELSK